jgi:cytosine/adenosine deaminase-related metal-dependent hydrolase
MLEYGVQVGLGVDGSASNDSSHLLAEARMAMLLQRVKHGAEALTATQALELATLGGARVLGREDIGALKPGMAADLIAFDLGQLAFAGALHDPLAGLVFCTPATVAFSIIQGRLVVEQGRLLDLDLEALISRHNRLADELVQRTEARYGHDFSSRIWKRAWNG